MIDINHTNINDQTETDNKIENGLEKLEKPFNGDYVAGLKAFIDWTKDLVAKKE